MHEAPGMSWHSINSCFMVLPLPITTLCLEAPEEEFQQATEGVRLGEVGWGGRLFCGQCEEAEAESGRVRLTDFKGSREPGGQQGREGLTCVSMSLWGCSCPPSRVGVAGLSWCPSPALLPPLQGLSINVLQTLAPRVAFHRHFFHSNLFFFSPLNANLSVNHDRSPICSKK